MRQYLRDELLHDMQSLWSDKRDGEGDSRVGELGEDTDVGRVFKLSTWRLVITEGSEDISRLTDGHGGCKIFVQSLLI